MKLIDDFLNNITMYRLMLYVLLILLGIAVFLSFLHLLPFSPVLLIFTCGFLLAVGFLTNKIFAYIFKVPANSESIYISTLILSLIIPPIKDSSDLAFLFWCAVWVAASKFIFAINRKHLFNPAALAVFLTALFINGSASWWVGTAAMLPAVLIGGFLIVKKIKSWDLFFAFLLSALVTILGISLLRGGNILDLIKRTFLDSPILFFGFIMLTEPLTTPPNKIWRLSYGVLIGFLFAPQLRIGNLYTTPEMALLLGNVFSYIVSPKYKLTLKLLEKIQLSPNLYDFIFSLEQRFNFSAGQYMEWTLAVKNSDSRGNRRYFTLASSPTENNVRLGVRFSEKSSAFKKELLTLDPGSEIIASSLSGEFTLPKDATQKLVFIAGGIGVTPFRSIIKYLLDKNEQRDIIVFYSVKTQSDAVYLDVFKQAEQMLGIKIILVVTDLQGFITKEMIGREVPDVSSRKFYLSGPHVMVSAFEKSLSELGLPKSQIKTDYFPGYV